MKTQKNKARPQRSDGPLKFEGAYAKRFASDRIAEDISRFNAEGGHIEVLGTTKVLKKIDGTPTG
ncbi:MAG TPA: hypothetical protein VIT66_13535 [Lysobacter sp.]|jgi:hypothetical protein|uniref:Uncharacterized protein n=1 Tax=Lysobacter niastensis TaxID=380629 RepID=A0ABU1WCZ9_9GAMM|nr:hypothetical protein [Lysobacter niastensis]MDR7135509.1 hypothetical protein [Lysobacter niastensis]